MASPNDRADHYDRSDHYGHSGGGSYGHSGGYGHKLQCCPLVVDPLTFTALLGAIVAGTAFLNVLITMNIMAAGRRKRSAAQNQKSSNTTSSGVTVWDMWQDIVHNGRKSSA